MALAGLNQNEKLELLELLELREQNKPEPVIDTRPSLDELFHSYNDKLAERSGDPAAWRAADEAHRAAFDRHIGRLSPAPPARKSTVLRRPTSEEMQTLFDEVHARVREATDCARRDGCPPANEINFRKPEEIDDELGRLKNAVARKGIIPRDLLLDAVVGNTEQQEQQRRAEERAHQSIQAEQDARYYKPAPTEALADFRGHAEPPLAPPAYPDS
jgi:hypothetical protein